MPQVTIGMVMERADAAERRVAELEAVLKMLEAMLGKARAELDAALFDLDMMTDDNFDLDMMTDDNADNY